MTVVDDPAKLRDGAVRALPAVALTASVSGLAWSAGGYDVGTWGLLGAALALFCIGASSVVVRGGGAFAPRVAVTGAVALVAWTAVGAFVAAADRSAAWHEVGRTATYALVLLVALVACADRSARRAALATLVLVTGALAVWCAWTLRADDAESLFLYGRFLGPVGYHNALAAVLLLPVLPGVALASQRELPIVLRSALIGSITACACVGVLPLSRGAALAALASLLVYLVLAPVRLRSVLALSPAIVAVWVGWPTLLAPYRAATAERSLADAGTSVSTHVLVSCLGACVAAAMWGLVDRRWHPARWLRMSVGSALLAASLVVVVAGSVVVVDREGGTAALVDTTRKQFVDDPDNATAGRGSISNNGRLPLWEVAVVDVRESPLLGVGADNWDETYYRLRSRDVGYVRQPHNLTLELLAERGVPGLLFAAFVPLVLLVPVAGLLLRRGHRADRAVVAASIAAVTGWLVQAQLDWLWQFTSLTGSVVVLVAASIAWRPPRFEAASGSGVDPVADVPPQRRSAWLAVAAARTVLVLSCVAMVALCVPLIASARYQARATDAGRSDRAALQALRRAERWNRWDPGLQRAIAARAERIGDVPAARRAMDIQRRLDPDSWVAAVLAARFELRQGNEQVARGLARRALALNPLEEALSDPDELGDDRLADDPLAQTAAGRRQGE